MDFFQFLEISTESYRFVYLIYTPQYLTKKEIYDIYDIPICIIYALLYYMYDNICYTLYMVRLYSVYAMYMSVCIYITYMHC